jgi:D-glycero-beta-D-manno-heptose-7-phosphate kinase
MSKKFEISESKAGPAEKKLLVEKLEAFKNKKVLILGDVGLDEYLMGEVRRISPEAPVPILEVESEDTRLGLAANVAHNVLSLGGIPMLVSVIGRDAGAESLLQLFKKYNLSTDFLVVDDSRPTTRKTRVMAKHHHLVRVDFETRKFIAETTEDKVFSRIRDCMVQADAVIIQDYAKGTVTQSLIRKTIELAQKLNKQVLVDPHRSVSAKFYQGADLIKPNFDEAMALAGLSFDEMRDHPNKVIEVGQAVQKITGAKQVVLTRGKDGMTIFSGDKRTQVATYARQVFDVTGAGDTVIAALALGLVAGLTLVHACMLANFAAGVVVGQVGCVPCTTEELKEYIGQTI